MRGFTFIELLVVIAIVGIISGVALMKMQEANVIIDNNYKTNQGK